jgi:hypothetical protein
MGGFKMSNWLAVFIESSGVAENVKNAKNSFKTYPENNFGNYGKFGNSTETKIISFLDSLNEEERMEYEERAAIMEYDGGLTREDAETQALQNVIYIRDYKNGK